VPNRFSQLKQQVKETLNQQKESYPNIPDQIIDLSEEAITNSSSTSIIGTLHTVSSLLSESSGSEASPNDFLQEFMKNVGQPLREKYFDYHSWKCSKCSAMNIDPYAFCYRCGTPKR